MKTEIRNPKSERNPKPESRKRQLIPEGWDAGVSSSNSHRRLLGSVFGFDAALLTLLLCFLSAPLHSADLDEASCLNLLRGEGTLQQKDAACARLKRIGTAHSVSALATLLGDEALSHSARFALESMPFPEAGKALVDALGRTTGLTREGIIYSLGNRRETNATVMLIKGLAETESGTAVAAANALGKLATPAAVRALQSALPGAHEPLHAALVDALLTAGNQLVTGGDRNRAAAIFTQLGLTETKEPVRLAAFAGVIRSVHEDTLNVLVLNAIASQDRPQQMAALQAVRILSAPGTTEALAELLSKVAAHVQVALAGVLVQRGDSAAAPAVAALLNRPELEVRLAAMAALGLLGDASHVPLLLAKCRAAGEPEQAGAREALLELRRGPVAAALIGQLASADWEIQSEVIRTLAGRAEKSCVPKLLDLARHGPDVPRKAALRALIGLADARHLAALTQLLVETKNPAMQADLQAILAGVCERSQSQAGFDVTPIVQGVASGDAETRIALLPVCSSIKDPRIQTALRAACEDSDARVKTAAQRALCATRDTGLLPEILTLAASAKENSASTLAIRGAIRLVSQEEGAALPLAQRIEVLKQLLSLASRVEEKRLILAGAANLPAPETLNLVLPLLEDASLQAEAAQAVMQIAGAIRDAHATLARAALQKVLAANPDAERRQAVELLLKQMEAAGDYLKAWQVAGPYQQAGKTYKDLFDLVFPPENPGARDVNWRILPAGTDAKRPGALDLLKFLGGEQRVAYARTRVYSGKEQPARLELGSDDGIKVWLNDNVVHANNTARALVMGADKVRVDLKQGWNTLLLKITQNNLGWEFCARLVKPDGTRLDDLTSDTSFPVEVNR